MRITRLRFLTLLAGAAALPMAATTMRNPVSGYVFDAASGLIRPINGLPGAAVLGSGLEAPALFTSVCFAPGQRTALAVSREGQMYWLQLEGAVVRSRQLEGAPADRMAFDATGATAVFYMEASRQYRILQAGSAGEWMTMPELPGTLHALAIDTAGKTLALAVTASDSATVFTLAAGTAELQFVAQTLSLDSLRLSGNGSDLLFADSAASQVMAAHRSGGEWLVQPVADGRDGVQSPSAAEWAVDGALVILSTGSNEILVKANGAVERLNVPAHALRLDPMAAPGLLQLAPQQGIERGVPLYLLEMRQQEGTLQSRVLFVPAGGQQ